MSRLHRHTFERAMADVRHWRDGRLIRITYLTWRECECGKKKRRSTVTEVIWDRKERLG